jgi:hypothetical protein
MAQIVTSLNGGDNVPVVLAPSVDDSTETKPSYRLGDLGRIFLVGISAPAGMTERNMLDVMPPAFACSDIPERDHFPSLKLKASYLYYDASSAKVWG